MGAINAHERKALQTKLTALWDSTSEGQAPARSLQMRTIASAIKNIISRNHNLTGALFWLDRLSRIVTNEDLNLFKQMYGPHEYAGLSDDENKFKTEMVQIAVWIAELQAPTQKKAKHTLRAFKLSNFSIPLTEKQKNETLLTIQKKIKETKSLLLDAMQYQKGDNLLIPHQDLNEYLKIHLFNAVKENRFDELTTILEDNPDIDLNCKDEYGRSLLSVAYLQRAYYHANRTDKYHDTEMALEVEAKEPLEGISIEEERKESFKKILPSEQEEDDSIEENEKILLLLLKKSDINTRTFDNKTILHLAVNQETPPSDLVLFLLKDADPSNCDKNNNNPSQYLFKEDGSLRNKKMHLYQAILLAQSVSDLFDPENHQLFDDILKDRKGQKNSLLEKELADSWIDYVIKLDTDGQKGQLLYYLLTHPNSDIATRTQQSFAGDKLTTKLIGEWIKAAGVVISKTNPEKAAGYYKQAAELGNSIAMQDLANLYTNDKKQGDLKSAVELYAKSYPLCEIDKNRNEIISGLKKICLQQKDHAARLLGVEKMSEIYHSRWDNNRPTRQQLTEQVELLTLLENIPNSSNNEKTKLCEEISQSWLDILYQCKTAAEQGEIVFNLLTHPHQRLREKTEALLEKNNITKKVGDLIAAAGLNRWETDRERASTYFKKASDLGETSAILNLAVFYHTHKKNPQPIEAIKLYAQHYRLSTSTEGKNRDINYLKIMISNEKDFTVKKIAVKELNEIYELRWKDAAPAVNLLEQIDYLTFLEKMPEINKKIRKDLCERIIHTIEHGDALQAIDDKKRGHLYYHVLTHSNRMLVDHLSEFFEQDSKRISSYMNKAGKEIMIDSHEKAFPYFKITASWGDPDGLKHLAGHYLYHGKIQNWEKAFNAYRDSYKYWSSDNSRDQIRNALKTMSRNNNVDISNAAKKTLEKIHAFHEEFYNAIKMAIILLAPSTNIEDGEIIHLDDGSTKYVSPAIARQWLLANKRGSIEMIINLASLKQPPAEELYEYYGLFDDNNMDSIIKKCTAKQKAALWTTSKTSDQPDDAKTILSTWANQSDGILKILNKSEELKDQNDENFIIAIDSWIGKFGSAETFSNIDQARQQQLSHRILEFSMSRDKKALASMLETKLVDGWKKDKGEVSQKLLSQFNLKKSQFKAALEDKNISLEHKIEPDKRFYNRLFSGHLFKKNASADTRHSELKKRK